MSQSLIEKHEPVVVEMAQTYLDNMAVELGKKYKNNDYQINVDLTDEQFFAIRTKHDIPTNEYAELYAEFQKMKPAEHLRRVMGAFTASGGNVDPPSCFHHAARTDIGRDGARVVGHVRGVQTGPRSP